MNIKEMADQLQIEIDKKMDKFNKIGKEVKELNHKSIELQKQMAKTLKELEPVEQIIKTQNPDKIELFDELLKLLEK